MSKLPAILVNYNNTPEWLSEYPDIEPLIYDRSDDGVERDLTKYGAVYRTKNMGDVDADKLGHLITYYDTLPDVFLWGKSNLFKYVDAEYLKEKLEKREYAPLLKFDHRTYDDKFGTVCYYSGNMYHERADSWFFNATQPKYFYTWGEWCDYFALPKNAYIPFPPGGNFILTRERVHRYSRDFYEKMREVLPHSQRPAEAQACERTYHLLWQ